MGKGIIVVDMAESCQFCKFRYDTRCMADNGHRINADEKPDWCPVRPMPEKPEYPPLSKSSYVAGWNDCVDYLEGRNGE